jgi:2-polyprenyl-6-methoxyphenol hydroxylase-like FAD-dependent oxidoreductase
VHVERAVVVGGGIGGLSAALALQNVCDCRDVLVLERSRELRALGAGIALWPNAINVLRRLGVGEAVEAAGAVATQSRLYTWDGKPLSVDVSGEFAARFGAPLMLLHRADLHDALVGALPTGALRLGAECTSVEQNSGGADVRLADGDVDRADVVIGADGIRSTVRARLFGDSPPRYSGLVAWRGVVSCDPEFVSALEVGEYWGVGSLFGIARIGGDRVYWYAAARAPEPTAGNRVDKSDLPRRFGAWHHPIPALIEGTTPEVILRTPLYDRPALPRWNEGRVALLGDAAHPMLPNLGQGAAQAIEDAAVLAQELAAGDDVPSALERYAGRRRERADLVVKRSRQMARLAHLQNPALVRLRNALMRRASAKTTLSRMDPVIGGDD